MASTLTKMLLHITFSSRQRTALISPSIEPDLYAYVGGIFPRMQPPLPDMGGTAFLIPHPPHP